MRAIWMLPDKCICGLAAAVTDLLQSVTLEYHGYDGESTGKGATAETVKSRLNELFSLVQGLGGTAVVRTYIDQLAQVLSALVGWSKIEKCEKNGGKCSKNNHGLSDKNCGYLKDVEDNDKCKDCHCMKWKQSNPGNEGLSVGRGCQRCKGSGGGACSCASGCTPGQECQCALAGKCCKCCCKGCSGKCSDKCICYKDGYMSAYPHQPNLLSISFVEDRKVDVKPYWKDLTDPRGYYPGTASERRAKCAQILLGSVCLIWSGITYMYWTGKWDKRSLRWNNHILDGSGLDDGTLSQWLQALGFPKAMLNNSGPKNRLDKVIWDGIRDMLYLGFPNTGIGGSGVHGIDNDANTFRQPAGMNYAGYIHTLEKGAFCKDGTVFKNGTTSTTDENTNKCGALYKLYILSCAYFTGLQKTTTTQNTTPKTPRTIREILYWLSALPYSQAYKETLSHAKEKLKEVLKKPDNNDNKTPTLSFLQQGRNAPITVDEYNLFAHFQAVTQYCPLVLIGIQGGLKGTDTTKDPPIHALYANTECKFTYPTVSIQAYNQVVHYIRALFYQLYFLRKQCAVKVTCGGKWRECRYGKDVLGNDVVSKGVISWMCLGCNPMEHDRKCRVKELEKGLVGLVKKVKASEKKDEGDDGKELFEVLKTIGDVVVPLGNAQEGLERNNVDATKEVLKKVPGGRHHNVHDVTEVVKTKVASLENAKNGLKEAANQAKEALEAADKNIGGTNDNKDKLTAAHYGLRQALDYLAKGVKEVVKNDDVIDKLSDRVKETVTKTIDQLISICNGPKCPGCIDHKDKCGLKPQSKYCDKCHQQYMDGFPSPLQAFLEDRLPGFSCNAVPVDENPDYPSAASHLGHCGGSGQCCPLPMGFRGNFYNGGISDMTGSRLYGILCFFSNENMMQSCVYTLVRVTAELSATTPQVLGDIFGFFRGGVGNPLKKNGDGEQCGHTKDPKDSNNSKVYFCGWCASGLRDVVKDIEWIPNGDTVPYRESVGQALINIKGDKGSSAAPATTTSLSALTDSNHYLSPLTGELYTAVSATFGNVYLSWVLYLSDALHSGLESLASEFLEIECRGCTGCDPNKCKKGEHGTKSDGQVTGLCQCSSIVSCTGVLPALYRHGFSYGNPFNLEGYHQKDGSKDGQYDIENKQNPRRCHEFLESLNKVLEYTDKNASKDQDHPLTKLLSEVGKLQYDIRLPWIFVLTLAWLVAVLYLAFGAIWPLDWTHMRSHWLRGGAHQWQCMWYKVMTGRKGMELVEYFGRK